MDTVFKIWDKSDNEIDILKHWGTVTITELQKWIVKLKNNIGYRFDKKNLIFSNFVIRDSIGTNLLTKIISLVGPNASGPELFLTIVL